MQIRELLDRGPILLTVLILIVFLVKLFLQFRLEKDWDPTRFFHYTRYDLKMTTSRELRAWRKRQNSLTKVALFLILVMAFFLFFNFIRK